MPSFGDLPSQDSYSDTIDRIIELKSNKKHLIQTNIYRDNLKLESLNILTERLELLRNNARNLQSIIVDDNNRNFETEDNQFISGRASHNAPEGNYEVEILQLAERQLLISEAINENAQLFGGFLSLKIGEEVINYDFPGGSVKDFVKGLKNASENFIDVNLVRKSDKESFFILSPKKEGYKNRIQVLEDRQNLLSSLKIFKSVPPIIKTFLSKNFFIEKGLLPNPLNEKQFIVATNQTVPIEINQTINFYDTKNIFFKVGFNLDPVSPPPLQAVESKTNITNLPIQSSIQSSNRVDGDNLGLGMATNVQAENQANLESQSEDDQAANQEEDSSADNLEGDNAFNESLAELKNQGQPILILKYRAEGEDREKTYTWKDVQKQRIWINDINLSARFDKEVVIKSVELVNQSTKQYTIENWYQSIRNTNEDKFLPIDERVAPKPAKIRYFSIEIEKDTNLVNDLIDGVELNLLKVSDRPVKFSITANSEGYYGQFVDYINQYNYAMELINILIAPSKDELNINQIDDDLEKRIGVYTDEFTIKRLKEGMINIMTSPYPVSTQANPIYPQQIGLEVFSSLRNPYHIDSGKIKLDTEKLQNAISIQKDKIKELFRYDKDGDFALDDGFAFRMNKFLTEGYLAPNSGLTLLENNFKSELKNLNLDLEGEQENLTDYRSKLERDFSKVRQIKEQQKGLKGWFDSLNNNN